MTRSSLESAVEELIQSIGSLVRRVRAASTANELSLTESTVLARLIRSGAATTAELARIEGVKPQSMGATVATLEEAKLVARKPHPTDGRQMLIEATPHGRAVREQARAAKRLWLTDAIAKLSAEERETLLEARKIIKRLAESDPQ